MESRVPDLPPLMGVQRDGLLMSYWVQDSTSHLMRVLHQKQPFPDV